MSRACAALLLVLIGFSAATADIVYLRDGTTREGKVVEQTDDKVVVEIAVGSTKARVTLNRADVDRIELKLSESEKLEAEYQKRLKAVDRSDADAVVALGKWCVSKGLFADAEALYKDLAGRGDAQWARAQWALANMDYDRGRVAIAKNTLKALLDKDPKNLDAKMLWDRISDEEKASASKLLADAVDLAAKGKPEAAVGKIELFHDRVSEAYAKVALEQVKLPGGMSLEEFVADLKLKVPCPSCRQGMKTCPACKGKMSDDIGICRVCLGSGSVGCDKCNGTGVKLGDVAGWELPAIVSAMDKRATAVIAEFRKDAETLSAGVAKDRVTPLTLDTLMAEARAEAWLAEIDALAGKDAKLTPRDAGAELAALQTQWRELCAKLGQTFDDQGREGWSKVELSPNGPLAEERAVRSVRDDLVRASAFYTLTRERAKDPYPPAVAPRVAALEPFVAAISATIERNVKILRAFDEAMKQILAKRARPALNILVEIVKVASKADLVYLSLLTTQRTNADLPDAMAALRFEAGRERSDFGETTEYERAAFIRRLMIEAEAQADEARKGFEVMQSYADVGRRNLCPTVVVHNTRDHADYSRKWYKATLLVPYALSADRRQDILDHIDEMDHLMSRCEHWYIPTPGPGPGPVPGPGH